MYEERYVKMMQGLCILIRAMGKQKEFQLIVMTAAEKNGKIGTTSWTDLLQLRPDPKPLIEAREPIQQAYQPLAKGRNRASVEIHFRGMTQYKH